MELDISVLFSDEPTSGPYSESDKSNSEPYFFIYVPF